jgi:hypothetical protein
VNQKWYLDLLYGGNGYPSWERSAGGPPAIFWFEATDEAWKGIDDGWGLWDESRTARYALCGTPAGPACNADVYAGAGYYSPPPFETITFDDPDVTYTLTGFNGAEDSQVVTDPAGGANQVARVVRAADAATFAGTIVATVGDTVGILPFDADNTRMTVRVYSPDAGIQVRLKVETSGNSSQSVETEATTTVANGWETLTFDFANPATASALNPSFTYDKVIIFFNFGVPGSVAGAKTYYFDDVTFVGGGGLPVLPFSDISFDSSGVVYTLTGFGGAEDSTLVPDPTDATNTVAKVVKAATAELWAGTTVSTGPASSVGVIPFSTTSTRMTVRVYSPRAGVVVRLKVEDAAEGTRSVETDAVTTVENGWETLSFDFANEAAGTAPLNLSYTYNKISIFFDFGRSGADGGGGTFYFDDVLFVTGGSGTPLVFASGYATNNLTVEGGAWGFYSDNFTDYTNTYAGGEFVDGANRVPAEDSYVFLVVATSAPTTAGYMGIFTTAGSSAGITLSGQSTLKIELRMTPEWFQQASNKALTVRLVGAEVYSDGANGTCQTWLDTPLTPTSADLATYTIDLAGMILARSCNDGGFSSGVTTVAEALAQPIGELHVQAVYPQVNTTVLAGAEYPTGFTRGAAWFE